MSETAASPSADPAATATPAPGAAPAPAPAETPAPAPAAGAPAASAPEKPPAPPKKSAAQRAAERAKARKDGSGDAAGANDSSKAAAGEPAPATPDKGATPAPAADAGSQGDDGTAGASAAGDEPAGSTLTAPDNWPEAMRERFNALNDDSAKQLVLDQYGELTAAFTKSTQQLSDLRKGHEALIKTIDDHGMDVAEASRVLELSANFETDPRGVLKQLAANANIPIYFEAPLPPGEIPEFKDTKEMAEWLRTQTLEAARVERERIEAEAEKKATHERNVAALKAELGEVRGKYGDAFSKAETAVMERLVNGLSVEDAYLLTQLPTLQAQAAKAGELQAELAKATAELEGYRKKATAPPAGANGTVVEGEDLSKLSPAERSLRRAAARKAAAAA